jgi:hypothetical protein
MADEIELDLGMEDKGEYAVSGDSDRGFGGYCGEFYADD